MVFYAERAGKTSDKRLILIRHCGDFEYEADGDLM